MTQLIEKTCVTCGADLRGAKRVKDTAGQYYCHPCWANLQRRQPQALPAATASSSSEIHPFSSPAQGAYEDRKSIGFAGSSDGFEGDGSANSSGRLSRRAWGMVFCLIFAGTLSIGALVYLLFVRDRWEDQHQQSLLMLKHDAEALVDQGQLAQAQETYNRLFYDVGQRQIHDAGLEAQIVQAHSAAVQVSEKLDAAARAKQAAAERTENDDLQALLKVCASLARACDVFSQQSHKLTSLEGAGADVVIAAFEQVQIAGSATFAPARAVLLQRATLSQLTGRRLQIASAFQAASDSIETLEASWSATWSRDLPIIRNPSGANINKAESDKVVNELSRVILQLQESAKHVLSEVDALAVSSSSSSPDGDSPGKVIRAEMARLDDQERANRALLAQEEAKAHQAIQQQADKVSQAAKERDEQARAAEQSHEEKLAHAEFQRLAPLRDTLLKWAQASADFDRYATQARALQETVDRLQADGQINQALRAKSQANHVIAKMQAAGQDADAHAKKLSDYDEDDLKKTIQTLLSADDLRSAIRPYLEKLDH